MQKFSTPLTSQFARIDKRTLLLIVTVLLMALLVLAAGAPCHVPPG
jgi:hypothetical protein